MPENSNPVGDEHHDEHGHAWFANIKRTYDEFQEVSLESIRRNALLFDKTFTDAQQHDNARQVIANQALQNAVETANMVGKQTVRHADIAVDRQWNVDEQGLIAAAAVVAVTKAINDLHENGNPGE